MGNLTSTTLPSRVRANLRSSSTLYDKDRISWDDFARCIRIMNAKLQNVKAASGETYKFGVQKGTFEASDEWRTRVLIVVVAQNLQDGGDARCRKVKSLNLETFLNVYRSFNIPTKRLNSVSSLDDDVVAVGSLTTSSIPEELQSTSATAPSASSSSTLSLPPANVTDSIYVEDEGKCCICFDNDADVILPCTHNFCTVCVARWEEYRTRFLCPLCKMAIKSPLQDSWETVDNVELRDYYKDLLAFVEDSGS